MITTFGEIMLRLTPQESGERILQTNSFRVEPGGSESNVSIALASLGKEAGFITRLPENPLGNKIIRQLKMENVETRHIQYGGERLGIYWTETGVGPRNSFVIYDRESSAFSKASYDDFDWNEIFKASTWFHFSGISPAVSESVAEMLGKVVNEIQVPYSVDLNYRKKLWNWCNKSPEKINETMTKLCSKATLIAGNESDFTDIFGINSKETDADERYSQIAEQAFQKFPNAKFISISNRQSISATRNDWNGFLFAYQNKEIQAFKSHTYQIDSVVDRVGTGDSFVAGIIFGIITFEKDKYQKTVDFATTLAALNHTTKGDASNFSKEEVLNVMRTKGSGRIVR